jgi:hypothetical protein
MVSIVNPKRRNGANFKVELEPVQRNQIRTHAYYCMVIRYGVLVHHLVMHVTCDATTTMATVPLHGLHVQSPPVSL